MEIKKEYRNRGSYSILTNFEMINHYQNSSSMQVLTEINQQFRWDFKQHK